MKLCMFSPKGMDLERGWPGKIHGDRIVQLAAQTLQAFFTGGGGAREHAEYPLAESELRAPVLYPPTVRVFRPFERGETPFFSFRKPVPGARARAGSRLSRRDARSSTTASRSRR